MDEFLRDYVQMMADAKEIELSEEEIENMVERLKCEDAIWDTVDFYIHQAFETYLEEDDE